MLNGLQATFAILGLCAAGVAAGLVFWAVKGTGHMPLSPVARLRYRGRAWGVVERLRRGESVTVCYGVDGISYRVTEALGEVRRVVTEADASGDGAMLDVVRRYSATTLGDLCEGGEIRVRYNLRNPSDAVLVPNPHDPYSSVNDRRDRRVPDN